MQPIVYYKDPNYDYENYNEQNDQLGIGYNYQGFDKLTLVNMVSEKEPKVNEHGGTTPGTVYYFLIEDTGEFLTCEWEEFCDITSGWYKLQPSVLQENITQPVRSREERMDFKFLRNSVGSY
jgi:hypothetical protein